MDVRGTSHSQSEVEEAYSDSDYSPGSLMIDINADDASSSVPSSPPSAAARTSPSTNRNRISTARRLYNTESNRTVFNGVQLVGKMDVLQAGHPKPVDILYLYAFGWGDFFLDVIARHSDSIIPVKNLYEKVIPGLKRNVLSARISKLQVKSEALMEPYVRALKKLGLVVTGASHFVGIVDFIKICNYFKTPPPDNLTKFYTISSEVHPDDVVRSFTFGKVDLQVQSIQPNVMLSAAREGGRVGGGGGARGGGGRGRGREETMGASCGVEGVLSPPLGGGADVRRLFLAEGQQLAVVVRGGEGYILKVELTKVLPAHSRDVLESIRRTYNIAVEHATKMEISALKCMGAVGGKAGRSALFRAGDVCQMFEHWKNRPPLALRQLANGKLPEKFDEEESSSLTPQPIPRSSSSPLPSFALSPYDVSADQLQPSITSFDMASALPHSTSTTFLHSHSPFHPATALDLPPFNSPQHLLNQQAPALPPPNFLPSLSQSFGVGSLPPTLPPFSHPPSSLPSSSLFARSSLTPDHLQQPIQLLNSLQQSSISPTPPLPHFSTSAPPPPLPPPPPHAHLPTFPPPPHHFQLGSEAEGKGRESHFVSPSRVKLEMSTRSITHSRRRSSSGPPLDDQGVEYSSVAWNDEVLTLLCPVGGVEPYLAIPELIQKVFHNRSLASSQQRSELGVTIVPATLLQVYALRAKGSLNNVTGNVKLISISGAVKLASVSNIQIPGTVIQTLKKYSKEPLESLITPVGFAPATRPPSTHPPPSHTTHTSHTSHPSQPSHTSHTSQPPPTSGALLHHLSSSSSSSQQLSRSTKGGKTVPQSPDDDASSSEDPAANVWPSKGVPQHPDLIDPGPFYTSTADGTYCLVKWGSEKLAALISSQKVHYMGLYQIFHSLFKQYVTRMNFKMRMRKLEIKSIRAASSVRNVLIHLDALPQSSPVCGLIRVSEVERLARSYGVEPPQVLYDVFLLRHSNQQKLPNSARAIAQLESSRKALLRSAQGTSSTGSPKTVHGDDVPVDSPSVAEMYPEARELQTLLHQVSQGQSSPCRDSTHQLSQPSSSAEQAPYSGGPVGIYPYSTTSASSVPSSIPFSLSSASYYSSNMPSTVFTTATSDQDALCVSVPRHLLMSHFRLVSRPVAPPGIMASFQSHSSPASSASPPSFRSSMLQNLAKKISQKSRKLGVGSSRLCPKCHRVNPPAKKRCVYCEEFLVGRACPACGTLNHNRTRDCFKCKATIASGLLAGQQKDEDQGMSYQPSSGGGSSYHQQGHAGLVMDVFTTGSPPNDGNQSTSPKSPLSPCFAAPPIRNAALKSMFPQESPKSEDSQVITKTMYSGNLSSSRKCMECGQLNSKMAKKCLQCRSPLQGRSCPKCGRPNHNHSPECYKCGSQLPSTTTKWVYVGSHSGRAYRSQESNTSSLNSSLKYRAQISCLRCERLRNNGKFVCGRCGDIYWTKPVVPAPGDETEGTHQHGKKKKAISEPNWNVPPEHDSEELQSFAQNILNLDISDQLLTMVNDAETYARERVYTAEEELEGVEEEYQSSAKKREEKENFFNDVRAELSSLIAEVERQQEKLRHLNEREEEAKIVTSSHPERISRLKEKIDSTLHLLMPETDDDKAMDCSQ